MAPERRGEDEGERPVNPHSLPEFVLLSAAAAIGLYEMVGWTVRKPRPRDLALAFLFLTSALYAGACAGQYNAADAAATVPWLRLQVGTLFLSGIGLTEFFAAVTGSIPKRRRVAIAAIFGAFALSQFLDLGGLTWRAAAGHVHEVRLPFLPVWTFHEAATGPLTDVQTAVGAAFFVFLFLEAFRFRHRDPTRGRRLLMIPLVVSAAWLVDLSVSYGLLRIPYAMEYAFAVAAVYAGLDRAERERHAEAELRAALSEKETLLRELYHRTKNNLQVVSSMLKLHATELESAADRGIFRDVGNKIVAMALVHQKLYESGRLSSIAIRPYLSELAALQLESHGLADRISLEVEAEDRELPLESALPLALATSELVSNSLKHAFPGGRRGHVSVEFGKAGTRCRLRVADDGVGLPPGFSIEGRGRMGTRTLESIARHQLRGTLNLEPGPGAAWVLEFDCARFGTETGSTPPPIATSGGGA